MGPWVPGPQVVSLLPHLPGLRKARKLSLWSFWGGTDKTRRSHLKSSGVESVSRFCGGGGGKTGRTKYEDSIWKVLG